MERDAPNRRVEPPTRPDALDRLRAAKGEIFLSLAGLDATTATTIHARQYYSLDDIVWNARFVDVLSITAEGTHVIDYEHFHDVIRLDET